MYSHQHRNIPHQTESVASFKQSIYHSSTWESQRLLIGIRYTAKNRTHRQCLNKRFLIIYRGVNVQRLPTNIRKHQRKSIVSQVNRLFIYRCSQQHRRTPQKIERIASQSILNLSIFSATSENTTRNRTYRQLLTKEFFAYRVVNVQRLLIKFEISHGEPNASQDFIQSILLSPRC